MLFREVSKANSRMCSKYNLAIVLTASKTLMQHFVDKTYCFPLKEEIETNHVYFDKDNLDVLLTNLDGDRSSLNCHD